MLYPFTIHVSPTPTQDSPPTSKYLCPGFPLGDTFAFVFSQPHPHHPPVLPKITTLLRAQYLVFDLFKISVSIILSTYITAFRAKRQKQSPSNFRYTDRWVVQAGYRFSWDLLLAIPFHENVDSVMALKLKLPKTLEDLSLAGVNWEKSCNGRHTHTHP